MISFVFSSHIASWLPFLIEDVEMPMKGEWKHLGAQELHVFQKCSTLGALPDGLMVCRAGKNTREPRRWRELGTPHSSMDSFGHTLEVP